MFLIGYLKDIFKGLSAKKQNKKKHNEVVI